MMRLFLVFFMILGLGFSSVLKSDEYRKKVNPSGFIESKKPGSYEEYKKGFPEKPFRMEQVGTYSAVKSGVPRGTQNKIVVLVNDSIYSTIWYEIFHYMNDIRWQGYDVVVLKGSGGSPVDIKYELKQHSNLLGCVMVGNFPSAWYEVENDYDEHGYAAFPCDLFYMDLDGFWYDSDDNGIYDQHSDGIVGGDSDPEIFLARIDVSGMLGDEISNLKSYFRRNHSFWNGAWEIRDWGLNYLEKRWHGHYAIMNNSGGIKIKRIRYTTSKQDYLTYRLTNPQYYITHLACDSNDEYHNFAEGGAVLGSEISGAVPSSLAYNIFHCYRALRYTTGNCVGKHYIFNGGKGLVVVGSTKRGFMINGKKFYTPLLSQNKCIGESLLEWYKNITPSSEMKNVYLHYGMAILGDPMVYLVTKPVPEDTMQSYKCSICGYIYDPVIGDYQNGVEPGTSYLDLPSDWLCPHCGLSRDNFFVED